MFDLLGLLLGAYTAYAAVTGRVFAKAMAYFLFFSTLALVIGMIVAHVVQPGAA